MRILIRAVLMAAALALSPLAQAHEGHDHDAPPAPTSTTALPRAVATSEMFELVAIAGSDKLTVYLDDFHTLAPVTNATVEMDGPAGTVSATATGSVYELPAPWLAKAGTYALVFSVTTQDGADVLATSLTLPPRQTISVAQEAQPPLLQGAGVYLTIGAAFLLGLGVSALVARHRMIAATTLVLLLAGGLYIARVGAHEGEDHGTPSALPRITATRDTAQRQANGSVFAPKPTQRLLEIRTQLTNLETHARSVELPGRIVPDPNASGYVQASVSGRLSPPPGGFPRLGTAVKQSDVLAYVMPPLTAAEHSDQRQRQGELDQQIAIVQQRIDRYERLLPSGAIAKVQVDEARLELKGLRDRRGSLDQVRRQPEALIAPVSGVVAAANAVAGQIAETNAIVYQIVDPKRLWVEAISFEALDGVTDATARTSEARSLALSYKGSGLGDRNSQSLPVHFEVTGNVANLRVGQLVTVSVKTSETVTGIALPRASLIEGQNGQAVIYDHTDPERFVARDVRTQPLDADGVLIADGVAAGRRIVTRGAELLNQVR